MENKDFHAISAANDIDYRKPGFSIAGMVTLAYLALLVRGEHQVFLLIIALIVALSAWLEVRLLRKAVDLLIRTGNVIHTFTNPLLFGFIYFFAVIPTAILLRLSGKDVLRLEQDKKRQTYWEKRPAGKIWKDSFYNQF